MKSFITQTFKMSFVTSMTQDGCEGIIGFIGTVDGDKFFIFLKGLLKNLICKGDDEQTRV